MRGLIAIGVVVAAGGFAAGWFAAPRPSAKPPPSVAPPAVAVARPPAASVGPVPPAPPTPLSEPRDRWQELSARPATIERDAELAELLADLVEADAAGASERLQLLTESERLRLGAAILWDAAREPARAARLALALGRADPRSAADYGYALVGALTRLGEFQVAVDFAAAVVVAPEESENPGKWTRAIFAAWAAREPYIAAQAARALPHEGLRGEALAALAGP